jgi:protein canopy 1/2
LLQCLEVLEDREEAVLKLFMEPATPKDSDLKLCSQSANYCNETIGDDYNYMDTDEEDENEEMGHTEL